MKSAVKMTIIALMSAVSLDIVASPAALAAEKMETQEIIQKADVKIGLSGLVCDFCTLALNKTFAKNKAVAASHVDLDAKVLSVVFSDGQTVTDDALNEMVKDAGYNITDINRANG